MSRSRRPPFDPLPLSLDVVNETDYRGMQILFQNQCVNEIFNFYFTFSSSLQYRAEPFQVNSADKWTRFAQHPIWVEVVRRYFPTTSREREREQREQREQMWIEYLSRVSIRHDEFTNNNPPPFYMWTVNEHSPLCQMRQVGSHKFAWIAWMMMVTTRWVNGTNRRWSLDDPIQREFYVMQAAEEAFTCGVYPLCALRLYSCRDAWHLVRHVLTSDRTNMHHEDQAWITNCVPWVLERALFSSLVMHDSHNENVKVDELIAMLYAYQQWTFRTQLSQQESMTPLRFVFNQPNMQHRWDANVLEIIHRLFPTELFQ